MSPSSASLRKQSRHSANLRRNARGRPQRLQRFRSRILNFGVLASLAIFAVVAMFDYCPSCLLGAERHAKQLQQLSRLLVALGRRHNGNVHAARLVDLHVVDLWEQQLVLQAERVVAATVETLRRHATEVAHARQRHRDQAIEEVPHALATQRDHRPDRHALADLELRDRLLRAGHHGLLAGDLADFVGPGVDDLRVLRRFAETHVDDDLLDLGDRHHVAVPELFLERRDHFCFVTFLEPAHLSSTPSHLRQIRTFRPSSRTFLPIRVGLPHSGQTICTFEACSAASRSTTPPLTFFWGFGLVCRLMMFTPSTTRRFFSGSRRTTRPRLPRSLPVVTTTLSFFRIGVANLDITENLTASTSNFQVPTPTPSLLGSWRLVVGDCRRAPQSTSGASEIIFMNRRSRSSRATGPNTRVPIGSLLSFTRTAALRSNRM